MIEPAPAPSRESVERAFDFAQHQVRQLITTDPDFFPMFTENGTVAASASVLDQLVRGFFARNDVDLRPPDR